MYINDVYMCMYVYIYIYINIISYKHTTDHSKSFESIYASYAYTCVDVECMYIYIYIDIYI